MKTHGDRLREAVREALRATSAAHTAAHRAKRKLDNLVALNLDIQSGSLSPTIKAFIGTEICRQNQQVFSLECDAWKVWREMGDLAELVGGRPKEKP